jgi:hypothetical protein
MGKGPTLAAVARHAGVSQATASRALDAARWDRVHPDTRRRILAAVNQLGYRRRRAATVRSGPGTVLPAEPEAWLAVDAADLTGSLRTARLYPDRQAASLAVNRANYAAPCNGMSPTWRVYALIPSHRLEETTADAS